MSCFNEQFKQFLFNPAGHRPKCVYNVQYIVANVTFSTYIFLHIFTNIYIHLRTNWFSQNEFTKMYVFVCWILYL